MEYDRKEASLEEFKRLLVQSLNDPTITVEIEEQVHQPEYGPWAKVSKFSGIGLYGRNQQRQRERERSARTRRQRLRDART